MSSLKFCPKVEGKLEVSADVMGHPLGFVIDSGGSLTKLVYRSKEDYQKGEKLHDSPKGILRLKSFTIDELPTLLGFIREHVDINLKEEHKHVVWCHTGISSGAFRTQLEKELDIKVRLHSETLGLNKCMQRHQQMGVRFHSTFVECIEEAAKLSRDLMSMIGQLQALGEDSYNMEMHTSDAEKTDPKTKAASKGLPDFPDDHYIPELLSTTDYQSWIGKHLKPSEALEVPAVVMLVGSAGVLGMVSENYKFNFLEFAPASGKTLCGLAEELVGEKDFSKFVQLAEEGDIGNVDMKTQGLKRTGVEDDDWYSVFTPNMTAFQLGHLSSNNINGKGKYSKADLAAGLLSFQLLIMVKMVISNLRISNLSTAYVCGSMFQFPHIRKVFESHFYNESIMVSLQYGRPFKVFFFDNPGYLVALGLWVMNIEKLEENKEIK